MLLIRSPHSCAKRTEGGRWLAHQSLSQSTFCFRSGSNSRGNPIPHTNHSNRASPTNHAWPSQIGGPLCGSIRPCEAQPQPRGWIAMGTWPHQERLSAFCLGDIVSVDHVLVTRDSAGPLFPSMASYHPYCGLPPRAGADGEWLVGCWVGPPRLSPGILNAVLRTVLSRQIVIVYDSRRIYGGITEQTIPRSSRVRL